MSWRSIVNRAVQIGVREGMKYLRQSQSRRSQGGADDSRGADRRPGPRPQGQGPTGNARTTSARDDRPGARWMNIGSGAWDSQGRPSEVRLDRIIRLDPRSIRREGAVMDRSVFALVAAEFS